MVSLWRLRTRGLDSAERCVSPASIRVPIVMGLHIIRLPSSIHDLASFDGERSGAMRWALDALEEKMIDDDD
ncbi:hypothetical protein HPP92_006068 [Vanilla planifolia]|uniref:Uncharacterized protein n=1 Tax=Vanilla planifolia TaxID=51239 RepID=A0A835RT90_VANPL|nr:hypothetical protein HPP92_006068 [Vanilla planifolia]